MSNIVKTNVSGYVKDSRTGMVYNKNYSELKSYREQIAKSKKINNLEQRLEELSEQMQAVLQEFARNKK